MQRVQLPCGQRARPVDSFTKAGLGSRFIHAGDRWRAEGEHKDMRTI